ncbi:hypothetical protein ULMA_02470 [Patiriisocius marinus]|uniref:Uncharacterized protein n=1 Tax=Patiriisocius marinus TaxID=1397112 RepID=A0A5J4ILZ6_9FLAO|nr:hypothetical protein ULMA_02470 [Patiriisocius marinus]
MFDSSFYSKDESVDKYIEESVRKNIIAVALDYENDVENFEITFDGRF